MTPERQEWLTTQYVWVIQNDGDWYRRASAAVAADDFAQFRRHAGEWVRRTRVEIGDGLLPSEDFAFIYLTLWEQAGGRMEGLGERSSNELGVLAEKIRERLAKANGHFKRVADALEQTNEPEEKENTVSQIAFKTVSYVYGKDVEAMTEEELIDAIKKIEAEIAKLKEVKTTSKKIAAKIGELEEMLTKVVGVLDGK